MQDEPRAASRKRHLKETLLVLVLMVIVVFMSQLILDSSLRYRLIAAFTELLGSIR